MFCTCARDLFNDIVYIQYYKCKVSVNTTTDPDQNLTFKYFQDHTKFPDFSRSFPFLL